MKKFTISILALLCVSFSALGQISNDTLIRLYISGHDVSLNTISNNGRVGTGYIDRQSNSFLWTDTAGLNQFDAGLVSASICWAISSNGIMAGLFSDTARMYLNNDSVLVALYGPGYNPGGTGWVGLPLPDSVILSDFVIAHANAISNDGSIVAGSFDSGNGILVPVVWVNGVLDSLPSPTSGQGGRALCISGDDSVIGGWVAPSFNPFPALWINDTLHQIMYEGTSLPGQVIGLSPNGQYAVLTINEYAALYDIPLQKLYFLPKPEESRESSANSVSDNGIIIGTHNYGTPEEQEIFIYSQEMGMFLLEDYLTRLNIEFPQNLSFQFTAGISQDGSYIGGFGRTEDGDNYRTGFVIHITNHLAFFNRPQNLVAVDNSYGNVTLHWDAPKADAPNTLSGYDIYRNGVKINPVLVTDTMYQDQNTGNGNFSYQVLAKWNTSDSSLLSEEARINVGRFVIPFLEDYASESLDTNFWNTEKEVSRWQIVDFNGVNPPSVFYNPPHYSEYSDYLISPYLSIPNPSDVILAFNIAVPVIYETSYDTLFVEVQGSTGWERVHQYVPVTNGNHTFQYQEFDISQFADTITRVRFYATGLNYNSLYWYLDNINIFSSEEALVLEVPLDLSVNQAADGWIHLNWANPKEIVNLSYFTDNESVSGIGNQGAAIIAVNKYTSNDLASFDGYKLTEISAYLNHLDTSVTPQFRLFVQQGGQRVVNQNIASFNASTWNSFVLNTAYEIDHTKDLYYGIEVVAHGSADLPIGLVPSILTVIDEELVVVTDGKSNLYSEDNGTTWLKLTDAGIGQSFESMAITGTLKKVETNQPKERLLGYIIYRNGEKLLLDESGADVTSLNNFIDMTAEVGENCYEIAAFYDTQNESDKSERVCINTVGVDGFDKEDPIQVYPNPVYDVIYINGDYQSANIYDLKGSLLMSANMREINVNSLTPGAYIIQIYLSDGRKIAKKLIKM